MKLSVIRKTADRLFGLCSYMGVTGMAGLILFSILAFIWPDAPFFWGALMGSTLFLFGAVLLLFAGLWTNALAEEVHWKEFQHAPTRPRSAKSAD